MHTQQSDYLYFRSFFAYFDETKCRWDQENNSCDDFVAFSSDSGTDSGEQDQSDSDTSVVDNNSSDVTSDVTEVDEVTDVTNTLQTNTDLTIDSTMKPSYQNSQCEPLDESWICSSGSRNHSLCIKFCTVGLDLSHVNIMCRVIHVVNENF